MKIYVMVDMEGISGICRNSQTLTDGENYQHCRRYMTWDVNACVDGCIAGGAKEVLVRDAHSGGFNLIWEELDPRGQYIQGKPSKHRMPDLEKYDGLILLGYHAMAGTPDGVLEHTMSSRTWQNFRLNGKKAGELAYDAAIAGDCNVPTIMTSGDDKLCKEAGKTIKGIVTAQVKEGLNIESAKLLPKEKAHQVIHDSAKKAVGKCKTIKPYKLKSPVRMRLELAERGLLPYAKSDVKIIDGHTYEVTGKTVEEAWSNLRG